MPTVTAYTLIEAGEKPADLKARRAELFRDVQTARESTTKKVTVTGVVLTIPDDHGYCIKRPTTPESRTPYRLDSFEDARSVAFGASTKFGYVHAIAPETSTEPSEIIHLSAFITGLSAAD